MSDYWLVIVTDPCNNHTRTLLTKSEADADASVLSLIEHGFDPKIGRYDHSGKLVS